MMQLALVIDLNKCVGCHACAVNCKSWNTGGEFGPLTDKDPYGKEPCGVWFNRVQTYEIGKFPNTEVINMPKSCMHCRNAPCVEACPTGASYKREDGVVLVDYKKCIGCKYCSWACPYGTREFDEHEGVMKKCTLCADRIYNENLPEEERKPACVLSCPTRARVFGDIDDPQSE
ncbi:MAG: 4Fe-4S dicluster domain-containing protein, partial [Nitrospirae bacterium]|nr:4Fe-4S dicluster domain-containing protein [Nitrospirota bacterium]